MKREQHGVTGERVGNGSEANTTSEPRFFSVGYIGRAHGVRGEVWVNVPNRTVVPPLEDVTHVGLGAGRKLRAMQSFRFHRGGILLMLEGCDDRTAAEALRGEQVSIPTFGQQSLKLNEYYVEDLVGLSVRTENGENLGELVQVLPTGANDVYRVVGVEGELLLPAITTVIRSVDVDNGVMVVCLLAGLRS